MNGLNDGANWNGLNDLNRWNGQIVQAYFIRKICCGYFGGIGTPGSLLFSS